MTMVTIINNAGGQPPDALEKLAGEIRQDNTDAAPLDPSAQEEANQAQEAIDKMVAGLGKLSFKIFKALRQRAARRLPELLDHVTDADLQGPAEALPPVIQKHLARLAPFMGAYPEEAMLLLSMLPIGMGYVAALEAHDLNAKRPKGQGGAVTTLTVVKAGGEPAANEPPSSADFDLGNIDG